MFAKLGFILCVCFVCVCVCVWGRSAIVASLHAARNALLFSLGHEERGSW